MERRKEGVHPGKVGGCWIVAVDGLRPGQLMDRDVRGNREALHLSKVRKAGHGCCGLATARPADGLRWWRGDRAGVHPGKVGARHTCRGLRALHWLCGRHSWLAAP